MPKPRVLVLFFCALVLCVVACGVRRRLYAQPAQLPGGVFVKINEAYVAGERLYVKTWMMNTTAAPMTIDRDGMALRLPDGRVLPRAEGTFTQHKPYNLAPGAGRDVHVDFKDAAEFEGVTSATLIVGGVFFGADPTPRVAGEVPLGEAFVSVPAGGPPATQGTQPAAPDQTQPAANPPTVAP
jgi:hypothetical protein